MSDCLRPPTLGRTSLRRRPKPFYVQPPEDHCKRCECELSQYGDRWQFAGPKFLIRPLCGNCYQALKTEHPEVGALNS